MGAAKDSSAPKGAYAPVYEFHGRCPWPQSCAATRLYRDAALLPFSWTALVYDRLIRWNCHIVGGHRPPLQFEIPLYVAEERSLIKLPATLTSPNMIDAAAKHTTAVLKNTCEKGMLADRPAVYPASLLPIADARNHIPIIDPASFEGASFVIP